MDSSKTFFLSLEKDREVVIGGTIPKSGADVSVTVVRARLQIASIVKSKPNRRRKEENCSLSLEY